MSQIESIGIARVGITLGVYANTRIGVVRSALKSRGGERRTGGALVVVGLMAEACHTQHPFLEIAPGGGEGVRDDKLLAASQCRLPRLVGRQEREAPRVIIRAGTD